MQDVANPVTFPSFYSMYLPISVTHSVTPCSVVSSLASNDSSSAYFTVRNTLLYCLPSNKLGKLLRAVNDKGLNKQV